MEKRNILEKKLKMKDVGRKYENLCSMPKKKRDKSYPTVCLGAKEAPFLEDMQVGDTCKIVCEVEIVGHSSNKNMYSAYDSDNYTLEIKKIGK